MLDIVWQIFARLYTLSYHIATFFSTNVGLITALGAFVVIALKESLFALYIVQHKEYRRDKLKEYFASTEGARILFPQKNILRGMHFLVLIVSIGLVIAPQNYMYELLGIVCIIRILLSFLADAVKNAGLLVLRGKQGLVWTKRVVLMTLVYIAISIVFWLPYSKFYKASETLESLAVFLLFSLAYLMVIFGIAFISLFVTLPIAYHQKNRLYKKAKQHRSLLTDLRVLGIAGSYGKSSVKYYVNALLSQSYVCAMPSGNINTDTGLAHYVTQNVTGKHQFFITEMGSYKRGETALIGEIIQHQNGFITGLNAQHIGLFGSLENAILAESEVVEQVQKHTGTVYLNANDSLIRQAHGTLITYTNADTVRYAAYDHKEQYQAPLQSQDTSFVYSIVQNVTKHGSQCILHYKGNQYTYQTDLIGLHHINNLTGAIAYALDQGMERSVLHDTISHMKGHQKTGKLKHVGNTIIIDDTYNINSDGVLAGCKSLVQYAQCFDKKACLVIDEIVELGDQAESIHYELGVAITQYQSIDKVLCMGKYFLEPFTRGLREGGMDLTKIIRAQSLSNKELLSYTKDSVVMCLGRRSRRLITLF